MEKSKVYFTRNITSENVLKMYKVLNIELQGRVCVKVHSGEAGNQNYLKPLFFKDVIGLDEDASKREAEKLKLTMEDNTINNLAKYVHKVLNLSDLNCDYDISKERCRVCKRRTKRPNA